MLSKREDGYHHLETVFYPVPLNDAVEIIALPEKQILPTDKNLPVKDDINFSASGLNIGGHANNNLCIKAYHILKKDFPAIPAVQMHLHKAIPMGAGLGGGSADAAFTLSLLNEKFHLNLSTDQLINYSLQLGSDCPFFIINKPCFATGRGELMEEIKLHLSGYKIVLVNPGIHVNTACAFAELGKIKKDKPAGNLKDFIMQPIQTWKQNISNDFEIPVFNKYPAIREIKETLYKQGAGYAAMSGSGSTVYGLFPKNEKVSVTMPGNYFVSQFLL